jgi:transposase
LRNERVASHVLNPNKGRHTTDPSHMPTSHKALAGWTPERFKERAQRIGPSATEVMERWLHGRRHPEQGFRSCRGLVGLLETYCPADIELACAQALALNAPNIRSIRNLLNNGMVQRPNLAVQSSLPFEHANVRGPKYYH